MGMLSEPIAQAPDLDDHGVMQQPIGQANGGFRGYSGHLLAVVRESRIGHFSPSLKLSLTSPYGTFEKFCVPLSHGSSPPNSGPLARELLLSITFRT